MKNPTVQELLDEAERRNWQYLKSCIVCAGTEWRPILQGRDSCVLCKCDACNVIFLNPRPRKANQTDSGYEAGHAEKRYLPRLIEAGIIQPDLRPNGPALYNRYRRLVDMVLSLEPQEPVLDIGCAIGLSMLAMRHKGIETVGFDVNDEFIRVAKETFELDVRYHDILTPTSDKKRYPIATLNAVLEHIDDPVAFLKGIKANILTPDGALVISLPNARSYQFMEMGAQWDTISGGHVWYPTEETTSMVAERAGLSVEWIYAEPKRSKYASFYEMFARELFGFHGNLSGGLGMIVRSPKPREVS